MNTENQIINSEGIERLQNTLERSKQLIKTTSAPGFDNYAKKVANGGYIPEGNEPFIPELSTIPSKNSIEYGARTYNNAVESSNLNTKMPKAILESLMSNPINSVQGNLSDLDALITNNPNIIQSPSTYSQHSIKTADAPKFSNYINENNQQMQTSQVDYSLIKMIVKECVNEALEKYMKDSDSVNFIKLGDNIKFLTKNGSLYEGKLNYKGNVKEKLNELKH